MTQFEYRVWHIQGAATTQTQTHKRWHTSSPITTLLIER